MGIPNRRVHDPDQSVFVLVTQSILAVADGIQRCQYASGFVYRCLSHGDDFEKNRYTTGTGV